MWEIQQSVLLIRIEKKKGKKKEKKMIQAISQGDSCIDAYSYLTILFYVVSFTSR